MAEADGQEKTEQPSGKKLNDARDEGKVAKSTEINSFAVFTTGLMMIFLTQKFLSSQLSNYSVKIFGSLNVLTINKDFVQNFFKESFFFFIVTLAPFLGALMVMSLVASIAQSGLKISTKALMPDFKKLNPVSGLKKVGFSSQSIMELVKSILKLLVVGGFAYSVLSGMVVKSTGLAQLSVEDIMAYMISSAFSFLWKVVLVYALLAAIDFIYQKKKFKKDMMMTKQEVKEENKQTEGDPQVKSRIKRLQYQAARNRMMQSVPKADVVITNPTHYAIALKYDLTSDAAPTVLAKGVDELAQRIKAVAVENGVPLHEDRELARALYRICDVGDQIPQSLFKAVAQVLAYVFQLKRNKNKKSII